MDLHYKINVEHSLIMVTVNTVIELPDVLAIINQYEQDDAYANGMNIIYDFREGAIIISSDGMQKLVGFLKVQKTDQTYKLALVSDKDEFFGQSRMFDAFAADLPSSIRNFRDINDCMQWINA